MCLNKVSQKNGGKTNLKVGIKGGDVIKRKGLSKEKKWYTTEEVAERYGKHVNTIRNWINTEKIPKEFISKPGKEHMIDLNGFEKHQAKN